MVCDIIMDMKEKLLNIIIGIGLVLVVILFWVIILFLVSLLVMIGWNFLVNPIFGFPKISFWMSIGLTLIYNIIFGGSK